MAQFNFTPANNYDGLLKQAKAMASLIRSMEQQRSAQNVRISNLEREIAVQGSEEINAQRTTNAVLTNDVEVLENKLSVYKNSLELIVIEKSEGDSATPEQELGVMRFLAQCALEI